ncbi:hypothetical protein BAY61_00320 [Prauserella marina]|uniref:Uncharacterized protein n=1 Tax=Prauserella marina TaxID=530584 RepID=A0A222VXX1_9PSEU|nr:hypothetical protein [Prauserella marina]ASR38826.1 hypothetical protein BAY61_00320 [Prauserella marina]PWV82239.1 hypothetical protein DES30_102478 [Prauserella marina]SDC64032.1 hypothetical protein SAMN05421630_10314 [Prauserella marina]
MAVTPGQTAVPSGSNGTRSIPSRMVAPIELPAGVDELAAEAAAQLGWEGDLLPAMKLFGRTVYVVANLSAEAHAERIALGIDPVADKATVSTWTWPELAASAPPAAAEIVGVLAVARHWRTGLAATVPFARYGDAAMVLPRSATLSHDYVDNCLPRARAYGLAVVTADENAVVDLDLEGRSERILLGGDAVSRWVNEMVYEQLVALECAAAAE